MFLCLLGNRYKRSFLSVCHFWRGKMAERSKYVLLPGPVLIKYTIFGFCFFMFWVSEVYWLICEGFPQAPMYIRSVPYDWILVTCHVTHNTCVSLVVLYAPVVSLQQPQSNAKTTQTTEKTKNGAQGLQPDLTMQSLGSLGCSPLSAILLLCNFGQVTLTCHLSSFLHFYFYSLSHLLEASYVLDIFTLSPYKKLIRLLGLSSR